jgi:hypothetical protein
MRRALLFSAGALLVVLAGYIVVFYGFNAVVKCEVGQYSFQQRARTVMAELASTNGCGF